jgi:hypothetical protein
MAVNGAIAIGLVAGGAGCSAPSRNVPEVVREAVGSVMAMQGIAQVTVERRGSVTRRPAENFGQRRRPQPTTIAVDVSLDERLEPDAAGEVARAAFSTLTRDAAVLHDDQGITLILAFRVQDAQEEGAATTDPCGAVTATDAVEIASTGSSQPDDVADATVDAFVLRAAGASHVSVGASTGPDGELAGASAVAPSAAALPRLAITAVELDRPVTLAAPGARYGQTYSPPDTDAVALVVSASQQPGVVCAEYLAQEHHLRVHTDLDAGSSARGGLQGWLEQHKNEQSAGSSWSYALVDAPGDTPAD